MEFGWQQSNHLHPWFFFDMDPCFDERFIDISIIFSCTLGKIFSGNGDNICYTYKILAEQDFRKF